MNDKWTCKCSATWGPTKTCPLCGCRQGWQAQEARQRRDEEAERRRQEQERQERLADIRRDTSRTIAERRGWESYR